MEKRTSLAKFSRMPSTRPFSNPIPTSAAHHEMINPFRGSGVELCHAVWSKDCVKICAVPVFPTF